MNKLWVRLSLAFLTVISMTVIVIFSLYFGLSWLPQTPLSVAEFTHQYKHLVEPFVEAYIIEGKSDEEIREVLASDGYLQALIQEKRADGFAVGIDIEDRSFGRIFDDYLSELSNPETLQIILIGTLFGIVASILVSRQLTRPLAELTKATQALGRRDLSQRVSVQGSNEIDALATAFNTMATKLEHTEQVRQNMLADVSHELRTPLAGLEGTLRATLDGVFELNNEHIGNLYRQTRHLTRLVEDLHLLARAEAHRLTLNKSAVDLTNLLSNLSQTFSLLAQEQSVHLQNKFTATPSIAVDAARIRQIVSNLLNNALRHTPSNGTIYLALTTVNTGVEISIRDTGEGIAPEHLPHLFDRFYRVDQSRNRETGGTGLGLAITKALVEAHGGSISAESNGLNQGSTFKVWLPTTSL